MRSMSVLVAWTLFCQQLKGVLDQFPVIMVDNSEQIRHYQEMVSEFRGVYKKDNFIHELNSQIPEANVA